MPATFCYPVVPRGRPRPVEPNGHTQVVMDRHEPRECLRQDSTAGELASGRAARSGADFGADRGGPFGGAALALLGGADEDRDLAEMLVVA